MGREEDDKNGFFVRFKHNVDAGISTGVNTVFGSSRTQTSSSSHEQPGSNPSSPDANIEPSVPSPDPSKSPRTMDTVEDYQDRGQLNTMALLSVSNYSPLALRELPRPVPNDLEPHMRSSIFTFEDAFEDLLAVSQGQELPTITTRYETRRILNARYPEGEPPYFWYQRLRLQGLLQMPRPDWWNHSPSPWQLSPHEFDRKAARVSSSTNRDEDLITGVFFRELSSILRQVGLAPFSDENLNRLEEEERQHHQQQKALPNHEHDLFSTVKSEWDEGGKTWDNFMKSLREGRATVSDTPDLEQDPKKASHKENQIVDKKEYVDRFGNLHSTVRTKVFDEQGNEIGSTVHHSIRSRDEESDRPEGAEPAREEGQEQRPRKVGLFWKREK